MAISRLDRALHRLRTSTVFQEKPDTSDGQLLRRFIDEREEAAFASLVRRHGPLVWGVCSRALGHRQDAEDAFQATFLVLARKVASIQRCELLANWLYGVAHRVCLRARAQAGRRRMREKQTEHPPEPAQPSQDPWTDLEPLIDQELSLLPEKYRTAVLLCDLQGKTGKEAARQLRIPEGTLSSRLRTGRMMLAKRLARHGLSISGGVLAALLTDRAASACTPMGVMSATIQAGPMCAAGGLGTASVVPENAITLMEGVIKGMLLTKLKSLLKVLLLAGILALGGNLLYRTEASGQSILPEQDAAEPGTPRKTPPKAVGAGRTPDKLEHHDAVPDSFSPRDAVTKGGKDFKKIVYSVADLVVPIEGLDRPASAAGGKAAPTKEDWLIRKITQTVAPSTWKGPGGKGKIEYSPLGHSLIVRNSVEVQEQVQSLLETMRRAQDVQLVVETCFVSMDDASYQKLQKLLARPKGEGGFVVSQLESMALLLEAQKGPTTSVLQTPRITFFSGQRISLSVGSEKGMVGKETTLTLNAFVGANLQLLHLDVKASQGKTTFSQTTQLQEGEVLICFERSGDRFVMLQVLPRVVLSLEK